MNSSLFNVVVIFFLILKDNHGFQKGCIRAKKGYRTG